MSGLLPFSWIEKAFDKTVGATFRFFRDFIEWRRRGARHDVLELDTLQLETAKEALARARASGALEHIRRAEQRVRLAEDTLISDIEKQRDSLRVAAGYYLEERVPSGALFSELPEPEGGPEDLRRVLTVVEERLLPPPQTAAEHLLKGNAYYEAGRYDDGLEAYNRALELHPDDADTLNNRGKTLSALGRSEEALADYDRALQLRPDDWAILSSRADALKHLGRDDEALASYDRSLEVFPYADFDGSIRLDITAHLGYSRARLLSLSNKADEALGALGSVVAARNMYRETARTDPDFDNIRSAPRFRELVGEEEPPAGAGASP